MKILIVDDNQAVLNFLKIFLLQEQKYHVHTLQDSRQSYNVLKKNNFDILLLDMDMPNVTGLDILKFIKKENIPIKTIVLTGVEDVDLAISAMKLGTFEYMLKPIDEEKLLVNIDTAVNDLKYVSKGMQSELQYNMDSLQYRDVFKEIITQDSEMIKNFHTIEKFAKTDNTVLIWGESGSGKELIARAIHTISNRNDKIFLPVNAGSFAQDLFSSEFFGHEKGAFTGAVKDKKGFLEVAHGGTLFLDEIGELSLTIQAKLLRFLQEDEFYRVGSTQNMKADVRIIAATNKNLFEEIKNGNFRKDIFFRLNINAITLPPLRERKVDIELLVNHFIAVFNKKYGKSIQEATASVINYLKKYSFPGNVRELMNIINSAIIIENSTTLRKNALPSYLMNISDMDDLFHTQKCLTSLKDVEKKHIKEVLDFFNNNRTKAAKILDISRVNLVAKIKKYGI